MTVRNFSVGQQVRHSSRGTGTIAKIDGHGIHVAFDDGSRHLGIFDDDWFRLCPAWGTTIRAA